MMENNILVHIFATIVGLLLGRIIGLCIIQIKTGIEHISKIDMLISTLVILILFSLILYLIL
jgi:ABC-type dipeptide/oligopeptide/nickel transport system permease subunit